MSILKEALDSLGNTEEEIVTYLREHNIKGEVAKSYCCPVAKALQGILNNTNVYINYSCCYGYGLGEAEIVPVYIKKFLKHFDSEMYKDLIKNEDTIN